MNISEELKIYAKHLKVLIVEDDLIIRTQLKDFLSLFYRDVREAEDGRIGIQAYRKEKFDIVITDLEMPNMNGLEFSKEVKLLNPKQTVVVLSGYIDTYVIDLIDIGITQLVLKPFEHNKFIGLLSKLSENIILEREFEKAKSYKIAHEVFDTKKEILIPQNSAYREVIKSISKQKAVEIKEKVVDEVEDFLNRKKVAANDFVKHIQTDKLLWKAFEENIDELMFLEEDFSYAIDKMYLEDNITEEVIDLIIAVLNRFNTVFSVVDELNHMARIVSELGSYLSSINLYDLNSDQLEELKLIEFIYEDMSGFLQKIFVQQNTIDIHYLEDSLESSISQMISNIEEEPLMEDESELELF